MLTTIEMDKAGRLVIPKRIRETLHLRPGSALRIEVRGDEIVLSPPSQPRGLYEEGGLLVYDGGVPLTSDDVARWIAEDREGRSRRVLGQE